VTLQFELDRDINGAAREVQAAIQAARSSLPSEPSQQPHLPQGEPGRRAGHDPRDDLGALQPRPDVRHRLHVLAQRISQLPGVGQVTVGGGSLPAVRVEINPTVLNKLCASASRKCARRSPRPTRTGRRASSTTA
jgi:multidrug efflux pump